MKLLLDENLPKKLKGLVPQIKEVLHKPLPTGPTEIKASV